jgi:predicted anti-sigma-YlaC factor YlaD
MTIGTNHPGDLCCKPRASRRDGGADGPRRLSLADGAPRFFLLAILSLVFCTGCSIKKIAINKLGEALAAGGTTFSSDDDPELVKAAVPFSLKLMESLLAESPKHAGLLFATSSGFTQYAYAFIEQEADEMEDKDLAAAQAMRARARRLYLRARNFGLRGLEAKHPGFAPALRAHPKEAVRVARVADVPLLFWTAASWGLAISPDNPQLVAEQPIVEALIDRALELDEAYGGGAVHSFLITYEMSRQGGKGDSAERARQHFKRAVELSRGQQAGPFVALAEAVTIKKQDLQEFESLLGRALAVDPDAQPEFRLANLIAQRRARWLLSRKEELFLIPEK